MNVRKVWVLAALPFRWLIGIGPARLLLCSWLLITLSACSAGAANNPTPTPAAESTGTLDGRYLVNGAPGVFYDFHATTGIVEFSKEGPGRFRVQGNTVTVTHANGVTSQLQRLDEDHWAAGSRFVLTRESVAQSAHPAATAANPWDADRARATAASDSGAQQTYECAAETVAALEQHMTHGSIPVVADIPAAGIHKKSDTLMLVDATSATAAATILKAAWGGGTAFRARCERPIVAAAAATDVPEDRYEAITGGLELLGHYYAAGSRLVDYEGAARVLDPGYAQELDAFRKRDRLKAFSARLDAAIQHAREHPYIRMPAVSVMAPAFDFQTGAYDLSGVISASKRFSVLDGSGGLVRVRLADPQGFARYAPRSESEARSIEAAVARSPARMVRMVLWGQVVQADPGSAMDPPYAILALTRASFRTEPGLGQPDAPLFTIDAR